VIQSGLMLHIQRCIRINIGHWFRMIPTAHSDAFKSTDIDKNKQ